MGVGNFRAEGATDSDRSARDLPHSQNSSPTYREHTGITPALAPTWRNPMFKLIRSLVFAIATALALPALAAQPVNINTAEAGAIATALSGIGQSKAEAIVAYRKEHGAFKTPDDLTHVKGIGQKTVDKNRELILVDGAVPAPKTETKPPAAASGQL
jgi:competence protein ComEA